MREANRESRVGSARIGCRGVSKIACLIRVSYTHYYLRDEPLLQDNLKNFVSLKNVHQKKKLCFLWQEISKAAVDNGDEEHFSTHSVPVRFKQAHREQTHYCRDCFAVSGSGSSRRLSGAELVGHQLCQPSTRPVSDRDPNEWYMAGAASSPNRAADRIATVSKPARGKYPAMMNDNLPPELPEYPEIDEELVRILDELDERSHEEWVSRREPEPSRPRERPSLERALTNLAQGGLQLDADQIKKNICSQFPDFRLWIREYIANAFDAQARDCWISGSEDAGTVTITVRDNGKGMDRARVETFLTKFRSLKTQPETAVGRFGIGSFSAAAIPGQCGFTMLTSTGTETWRLATGSLLESQPILVEQVTPVQPTGSTFSITFEKQAALAEELRTLYDLARKHLSYLPILIHFEFPSSSSLTALPGDWLPGNWAQADDERFSKRYCFNLNGKAYDAILAVGPGRYQLYQKGVLITENRRTHDLLSQDTPDRRIDIEHLSIRLESPDFEMPLGRHCLSDTRVLNNVSQHLRETVLPAYMEELVRLYEANLSSEFLVKPIEIEDMLSSWMASDISHIPERFKAVKIFATQAGRRLSYADILSAKATYGLVYLEDRSAVGLDYSAFEAPVLSFEQPKWGLGLLANR